MAVGLAVMGAWVLRIPAPTSLIPGYPAMVFNTALCFTLAGVSLFAQSDSATARPPRIASLCNWLIVGIAGIAILEYAFRWSAGIDNGIVAGGAEASYGTSPARMSLAVAAALVCIGSALITLDREFADLWRPSQFLALAAMLIGCLGRA